VAKAVFEKVDPNLNITLHVKDGESVSSKEPLLTITGSARSILKGERVALNFLGRMCGIASLTRQYCDLLQGTKTQLLDTRKTIPGLRILEKTATVTGGARNHRFGLCDGVLVKENHIRAAGGISAALERLHESLPPTLKIEVETSNLDEVREALSAGADIIMLDNMDLDTMSAAVRMVDGRAIVEASGNVTLERVQDIASCGVDFISSGAIIHSAKWSDLSLLFDI
jgi:nicotinate-nucleotide pyrophosphorylase (carboxylating)